MPFKIRTGPHIGGEFCPMLTTERKAKRYDEDVVDEITQEVYTNPRYALPTGLSESDFEVTDLTEAEAIELSDRLAARRSGVVQWFGEVVPWNEEVDGPWVEA